jgi:hypothetical protein
VSEANAPNDDVRDVPGMLDVPAAPPEGPVGAHGAPDVTPAVVSPEQSVAVGSPGADLMDALDAYVVAAHGRLTGDTPQTPGPAECDARARLTMALLRLTGGRLT